MSSQEISGNIISQNAENQLWGKSFGNHMP